MRPIRMTVIRVCAAVGLAFSFLVLVPVASYACSCVPMSTADQVSGADVVVRGTVESRQGPPAAEIRSSGDPVTYTLSVSEVYKGSAGDLLEVRSALDGASCGLEGIRSGREYVFFTGISDRGETEGQLWANLCGGTAPATPALVAEVVSATGSGTSASGAPSADLPNAGEPPTLVDAGGEAASDADPVWPWLVGVVALAAAAGTVLWRRTR